LLLADYYAEQRVEDRRAYLIIWASHHFKELPDAGKLFPLLRERDGDDQDSGEEVDDEAKFQQVVAGLTPYNR
jgi:hypothetical protein